MAKAMKATELRAKSPEELGQYLVTTEKALLEARFQNFSNMLNDTSRIGKLRADLARGRTVQAQQRASAKGEGR